MAPKGKTKRKRKKASSPLGGVPLGSALEVAEGVGGFLMKYFAQRYQVEEKVEEIKEETAERVDEIREEAVRTGYAVKKAFFEAIVEAVILMTGMVAIIYAVVRIVGRFVDPPELVLLMYGVAAMAFLALKMKLAPEPEQH
ncbi:MAG: hypothetical protein GF416_07855 [Candidatus Altiarchaeales archaeon]|nr:hypothetical protein [Candidatus Altiarchaeales archaeon]MBD3417027.1 hypothetical protein [Candidatus Altiarchaeales archaeon]